MKSISIYRLRCWLPLVLTLFIGLMPAARSQTPSAPERLKTRPIGQAVASLKVVALAGNQEFNDLERRIMAPLVVQVLDQNSNPVEGADVTFHFPTDGPGATFPNQQKSQTFQTNADGQAAAVGWIANTQVGMFQVDVFASRGNEIGETTISMTNVTRVVGDGKEKRKRWWSSKWAKVAFVAAAVGTVILLTRDSDSGGPTITASPGSPTVGGPQ